MVMDGRASLRWRGIRRFETIKGAITWPKKRKTEKTKIKRKRTAKKSKPEKGYNPKVDVLKPDYLETQWLKRELEKTYPRARALGDEVDSNDYEAVCLFESDMEAFSNQYGREPKEPLEWLTWRKNRCREEIELMRDVYEG